MGLRDRVRAMFGGVQKGTGNTFGDLFARGQEYLLVANEVRQPYTQVATVAIAINRIAEALSKVDLKLVASETEIEDDTLMEILESPSDFLRGNQLMYATAVHLCLHGEAFWRLTGTYTTADRFKRRLPAGIEPINPCYVREKLDKLNGDLVGWEYSVSMGVGGVGTDVVTLKPEEVVFFRRFNPYHRIRGLSPLQAARLEYSLDWKSASWSESFFSRGARPPFYVYTPPGQGSLPPGQRGDLQTQFEQEFAGLQNSHRVPVLNAGRELRPLGNSTHRDLDFLEGRRFSREQILGLFGVPPAVAGVFEYANYANSSEQKRYFWNHTIRPMCQLIEDTLQATLVKAYAPKGADLEFCIEEAIEREIPEDYQQRIDSASKLWAMGVPFADVNERLRLGFDTSEDAWHETGFLPFSVQNAETVANPPEPAAPDQMEPIGNFYRRSARPRWSQFKSRLDSLEQGAARAILSVYARVEQHAIAQMPQGAAVQKGWDYILPLDFDAQMDSAVKPVMVRALKEGGDAIIQELALDTVFDFLDPLVQAALRRRSVMIVGTNETIRKALRDSIAEGISKGETWDEIRQRVRDAFGGFRSNARTIARTEVNAAFNDGRLQSMIQNGVRRHQWLTAVDDLVRPSHRVLDAAVSEIGTNQWYVGGKLVITPLRFPHDPLAPPGETINCRCVTVPMDAHQPPVNPGTLTED